VSNKYLGKADESGASMAMITRRVRVAILTNRVLASLLIMRYTFNVDWEYRTTVWRTA
jgi:hypothetical protein